MRLPSHESMAFLKWAMRRRQFSEIAIRIWAVILARRGKGVREISRTIEFSEATVGRWLKRYRELGIEGLDDRKSTGRPPKLNEEQKQEIAQILDAGPGPSEGLARYRLEDLQRLISKKWKIRLSTGATWKLVTELGFSHRKVRPRHYKQSPKAIASWKRKAFFSSEECKGSALENKSRSGSKMKAGSGRRGHFTINGQDAVALVESVFKMVSSAPT